MQQPSLTGVGQGQAAIEAGTEPEGVVASLVLGSIDQGTQALIQLRRDDRAFARPVFVGPGCDLERVGRCVWDLVPLFEIRVYPHSLKHPLDRADRALGPVYGYCLADQPPGAGRRCTPLPSLQP